MALMFSFEYIIDSEVGKTEEDPQEQLQLKVACDQCPNWMTWSRRRGTKGGARLKKIFSKFF